MNRGPGRTDRQTALRRRLQEAVWRIVLWVVVLAGIGLDRIASGAIVYHPQPAPFSANVPSDTELSWSTDQLELIQNGGFEAGALTGWTVVNEGNGAFELNDGSLDPDGPEEPSAPLTGAYGATSAPLPPGGIYTISQTFAIPASATSVMLRWADRIRNFEPGGTFSNDPMFPHAFRVELRDSNNILLTNLFTTAPGEDALANWQKRSVDLMPYRGRTVRLGFVNYVSLFYFSVHLDNISLIAQMPGGITNDVYVGTNAVLTANDFLGQTTNTHWSLTGLKPSTAYFWRLISRWSGGSFAGPVWEFETGSLGSLDHYSWSEVSTPQIPGELFQVTATARDWLNHHLTDYNGAAQLTLSALAGPSPPPATVLSQPAPTAYTTFDHATTGYAFTPNQDLWVTGLDTFSGGAISLWTHAGVQILRQSMPGPAGSWRSLTLPRPIPLAAGRPYRVGVYVPAMDFHFARFDLPTTFDHGVIHQSYVADGDGFPSTPHPARWWLADLNYFAQQPIPIPGVSPRSVQFTNGIWSGMIVLPTNATNVVLRLETDGGIHGVANLFDVLPVEDTDLDGMPDDWEAIYEFDPGDASDAVLDPDEDGLSNLEEYRAGTHPKLASSSFRIVSIQHDLDSVTIEFSTVAGKVYRVERADSPSGSWMTIAGPTLGTGKVLAVTDPDVVGILAAFYRILVAPQ